MTNETISMREIERRLRILWQSFNSTNDEWLQQIQAKINNNIMAVWFHVRIRSISVIEINGHEFFQQFIIFFIMALSKFFFYSIGKLQRVKVLFFSIYLFYF